MNAKAFLLRLVSYIVLFFIFTDASAQVKNLRVSPDTTFWVAPNDIFIPSIRVEKFFPSEKIPSLIFSGDTVFFVNGKTLLHCDSVILSAKTLPEIFADKKYFRSQKEYDSINNEFNLGSSIYDSLPVFDNRRGAEKKENEDFFETKGLAKTGSISRGVSGGNRQDVFVNSALNMQLDGKLSEDISVKALISDQNVPFQPEGNTQNIQEFDKVIVTIEHKNFTLNAGNILLKNPENYFSKFQKNVMGGQIILKHSFFASDSLQKKRFAAQTSFAASAARGQFQNMTLKVFEGVQGPYRLTGSNNERFIMILAASERVFLDGILLKRGFQFDYIIDYNTAELTFTSRVVIGRFSRIRVEFEYATQYYNRSIIHFQHTQNVGKWSFLANFYREKDNPNAALTFTLDSLSKSILKNAGDSLADAYGTQVQMTDDFDVNRILYTYKDTTETDGTPVRVYVRAAKTTPPFLLLNFSQVADNQGDYRQGDAKANGREYVWVGKNKGNFSPVRLIPAPNQKLMSVFASRYQLSSFEKFSFEAALSQQDANLLSEKHNEDNIGEAFKLAFLSENRSLWEKKLGKNKTKFSAELEYDNENFRSIDRFRPIEFDRDWSYSTTQGYFRENILQTEYYFEKIRTEKDSLEKRKFFQKQNDVLLFSGKNAFRHQKNNLSGNQHLFLLRKGFAFFTIDARYFILFSQTPERVSHWKRYDLSLSAHTRAGEIGVRHENDKNRIVNARDSVLASAMFYEENKMFVKKNDTVGIFNYYIETSQRRDFVPDSGKISPYTDTKTYRGEWSLKQKNHVLRMNLVFREVKGVEKFTINDKTTAGNFEWRGKSLQGSLQHDLIVQVGTGREQKRDFVYVPVDIGQGTHVWRDDNKDNVQQINEFYEAVLPDEKIFVKFWLPSGDFVNAYSKDYTFRLVGNFPLSWQKGSDLRAFLARFSNIFSLSSLQKNTSDNTLNRFLPFSTEKNEKNIIAEKEVWRSSLFFNKTNQIFSLEWAYGKYNQKNLLAGGFEKRESLENRFIFRLSVKKNYIFRSIFLWAKKESRSDFMANRNYLFSHLAAMPELAWQVNNRWRATVSADFTQKNAITSEKSNIFSTGTEIRSLMPERIFSIKVKFTKISYDASPDTPLAYEMLDALQIGANWQWEINVQQNIFNGLRLNVNYNGRKSAEFPVVHTGRVQITAMF